MLAGRAIAAVVGLILPLIGTLPARAQASWLLSDLVAAAKQEGSLTVYSSVNEQEGLPLWHIFEAETGIHVDYIRGNDAALTSKIAIEARTGQSAWDLLVTTSVTRLPATLRAPFDPPEAASIIPQARGADRRWYGVYANYNAPSYNTGAVRLDAPPADLEAFLTHTEWVGHVGIDALDFPWLRSVLTYYGEDKGAALARRFFGTFKPTPIDGHLALARAVGSGEMWVSASNYVNLTNNVRAGGAPTDYWGQTPVGVVLGEVAVDIRAPHPNAARLAANFLLSREGQTAVARLGRLPVRSDVPIVPPDAITKLRAAVIVPLEFTPEEEKIWQRRFQDFLRGG